MPQLEDVKQFLENKLPEAEVLVGDLTGTLDHLDLTIISDSFEGKTLLARHRMVMDVLKERLKDDIHAVQIKTFTRKQYEER